MMLNISCTLCGYTVQTYSIGEVLNKGWEIVRINNGDGSETWYFLCPAHNNSTAIDFLLRTRK